MAHLLADRVKETTTTTGTGNITLAGAVSGFLAFSARLANNDTTLYCIVHQTAAEWEVGVGTWQTGGTLVRTTVLASSNADAAVNFSAGTKDVFITLSTAGPIGTLDAELQAASDTEAGQIEIAVQAEMEAGTDNTRAVVPGRQHFHPSAAKFWVKWTGNSTTIVASYNMTSIADTGVGDADGTIATDFSSADWCGQVSVLDSTSAWDATFTTGCGFNAQAAGTFGVLCSRMQDGGTAAASLQDPDSWHVSGFGDQA